MKNRISKYVIKTLSSEEFDQLPYKYAREADGLTDRFLNIAYIRDTGDTEYDDKAIAHEIEEMETNKWSHEDEFGVRYGFGDWLKKTFVPESKSSIGSMLGTGLGMALAPFTGGTSLAFLNPATLGTLGGGIGGYKEGGGVGSTLMGGLKGFGVGSIGSGLSAMAGPKTGLMGNLQEFGAGAIAPTQKLAGMLGFGGTSTGTTLPTTTSTLGSSGAGTLYGGAAPTTGYTAGGIGAGASPSIAAGLNLGSAGGGGGGGFMSGLKKAGSKIMDIFKTGPQATDTTKKAGEGFNLGKTLLGAGITGAGQMMAPKVGDVPESRFASMLEKGGVTPRTELGQQAMSKASELLAQNPQGLPEDYKAAILADFDKQDREEEEALRKEYKMYRPNADIESDSGFKRDLLELKQEQSEFRKNTLAKLEQANLESNKAFQRQDIINAMGIDEQTFNEYVSLANMDLNKIMLQTGLDYGTAQQFKEMFGQLGGMVLSSGLGLNSFVGGL